LPSIPNIQTDRPVFLDTKAGIVMADNYMTSVANYLRKANNLDIYEDTVVTAVQNNPKGVTLQLKVNGQSKSITSKKVALSCGRWITELVPEVKDILKSVRQTIAFFDMKTP
jgi:glycine/D-amino acid oxidase-like deaminating enzyme